MTEFYNPDSWLDVLDHVWIGLILVAVATIPTWLSIRSHRKIKDSITTVTDQVANGHDTPLRADVDRLIDGQDHITRLVTDIHGLVVDHNRQIQRISDDVDALKKTRATRKKPPAS